MKAVVLGATMGMGCELARQMVQRGDQVFVLGIEPEELRARAADLTVRGGRDTGYALCDLLDPSTFGPALDAADAGLGGFDTVIVTAAMFATQERLEDDRDLCARMLLVNFTNTVLFCEEARERLLARGGGTLCAFSSVAGDRGRKPVVLYGASKAGVSHYLESLDHKFRSEGLVTVCVKPGFVKTGMTFGLKPPPFAGEPADVARRVLKAIDQRTPVVYAPAPWSAIMRLIRALPRGVMRRVNF